ncbi:DMT family transporter [Chromobacterium subtsugae]|uniref:DMT family transporter n=1 Tax=Chromobacterium subtsugae TaxID=251747 RepID=UPI000AADF48B
MVGLRREAAWLTLLAAIWGASFLFMRIAAPVFGPLALIALRVGLAACALLPLMAWRGQLAVWRAHWPDIALTGIFLTAFPFCLIAWAQLSLPAGMASVLNATTPLMTALWAWPLAGEKLTPPRLAGLALGLAGVLVLLRGRGAGFDAAGPWPVLAMLGATASYGWAGQMVRRRLPGLPPLATAGGGLASGALLMLPLAAWAWPAGPIPAARLAGLAGAGLAMHRAGLPDFLPADRQAGRHPRQRRHLPGAGVRRAVGRAVPGRGAESGHAAGGGADPRRGAVAGAALVRRGGALQGQRYRWRCWQRAAARAGPLRGGSFSAAPGSVGQ